MTRPIPIAFGITDLDVGGAEKSLVEMVTRLDRDRWSPSVVCLKPTREREHGAGNEERRQTEEGATLAQRIANAGIRVESLGMTHAWEVPVAVGRWRRILREQSPAALVTFLFHANVLGRIVARMARVPCHVSGVRVAQREGRWHLTLDRWTKRWTDHYVCVSQSVAHFTQESVGVNADQITVIPNGVDVQAVDAARPMDLSRYGISADDLVLLVLGRLDRQKSPYLLVNAVDRIRERAREHRLRVFFVGEGPLRPLTEATVQRLGLSDVIRFAGPTSDPFGWLKACHGLALPSAWEGMPNVVLEAMAASKPVIATAVDGVVEIVRDGRTGWLAEAGCDESLARKILDWMTLADKRREFGLAGRKVVEERFRIESTVEQWDRLLDGLLATRWHAK